MIDMGGGRKVLEDEINHAIGLEWLAKIGDTVERNQPLLHVYCTDSGYAKVKPDLMKAITLSDDPVEPPSLIVKRISG